MTQLYSNSDFTFTVNAVDPSGNPVDPSTFQNAEWSLYETGTCTPIVTKTLGNGITVNGTNWEVSYEASDITVSGVNGEYTHAFRPGTTAEPRLPAIFDTTVPIVPGCP